MNTDEHGLKSEDVKLCCRFGCDHTPLIFLRVGESKQTENGFLIVKSDGWYCPKCAGGYGGRKVRCRCGGRYNVINGSCQRCRRTKHLLLSELISGAWLKVIKAKKVENKTK